MTQLAMLTDTDDEPEERGGSNRRRKATERIVRATPLTEPAAIELAYETAWELIHGPIFRQLRQSNPITTRLRLRLQCRGEPTEDELLDQDGRPYQAYLEYMAQDPGGPAAYRIARDQSGRVIQWIDGQLAQRHKIEFPAGAPSRPQEARLKLIANELIGRMSPATLAIIVADPDVHRRMRHDISQAARELALERWNDQDLPEDVRPTPPCNGHKPRAQERRQVNELIRLHITEPRVATLARRENKLGSGAPTAQQYNAARGRPDPATMIDGSLNVKELSEAQLVSQATQQAKERIDAWTPLRYGERVDGVRWVEIMVNEANPGQVRAQRETDGRITVRSRVGEPMRRLNFNSMAAEKLPVRQAAERIAEELIRIHPDPADILTNETALIHAAARQCIEDKLLRPEMPRRSRITRLDLETLGHTLTRVVRTKVVDQEAFDLADKSWYRSSRPEWQLRTYNVIARNIAAIREARESSPSTARWFLEKITQDADEALTLRGPSDITRIVREEAKLPRSLWKWFVRMRGEWPDMRGYGDWSRPIGATAELLQQANRPDASQERMRTVQFTLHETLRRWERRETNPEAWRAWVMAVNRYLALTDPETRRDSMDLSHISDAIRHNCEQPEPAPWGPATWNELVARADRILQRNGPDGRRRTTSREELKWESAIVQVRIGEYQFEALTSTAALGRWGEIMDNCMENYDGQCNRGEDRVFIAQDREGNLVAAIQLHNAGRAWQCVQTEGPNRNQPPDELAHAADQLAKRYTRAHRQAQAGAA